MIKKKEWVSPALEIVDMQEQLMQTESLRQGPDVPGGEGGELNSYSIASFLQNTIEYDTRNA